MSRDRYVVGNWKMNKTTSQVSEFFAGARPKAKSGCHYWIAPQALHIGQAIELASEEIKIGVQDCAIKNEGAFTGENSPLALKDLGGKFVIIGHSEQRAANKWENSLYGEKILAAQSQGHTAIYCVGETLEQRESAQTMAVIEQQLLQGLEKVEDQRNLIIAYEPVWAIGTGKTASPAQAEEVHRDIRPILNKSGFKAEEISILYGGSVKPGNFQELIGCENIDGGLVGGASLKVDDFLGLCEIAATQ